jgi:16S rRNA (adenine1518-N6/adenine1519-N6)-dimethyltransferase
MLSTKYSKQLPTLENVLRNYGIQPKKALGQNFLLDCEITDSMVLAQGSLAGAQVLEVGPGPGALTRSLLASEAARIVVLEKDERCLGALYDLQQISDGRLEIIQGDALHYNYDTLIMEGHPWHFIANLPYNIGTVLLRKLLEKAKNWSSITIMLQKEVVDRLIAMPGTKPYGALTIMTQWKCDIEKQFDVDPIHFHPSPNVISSVVRLIPLPQPHYDCDEGKLEHICRQAFNQRRKMLRRSLKGVVDEHKLEALGINPALRAEELSLEQFCMLANACV